MPGLVPGIHVFKSQFEDKTWMAGTSPAMTDSAVGWAKARLRAVPTILRQWRARHRARSRETRWLCPTYFFPIFSHSHFATASGELLASLPLARRLASRMVAMSMRPSSGISAVRKIWSSARFGEIRTIAS
ncbi:MAG: hypothetical protein QOD11_1611 [Bradyrhizobium sp.]|nr:hypothetical protein [Bradyrhizobium sp.]